MANNSQVVSIGLRSVCFGLFLLVITPLDGAAGEFRARIGVSSSRAWWHPQAVPQPLFARVGLSGGIGYDLAKLGTFILEPQILVSQKYRLEIWNHRSPREEFELIFRFRYVDFLASIRTASHGKRFYCSLGPQISIPVRLEQQLIKLDQRGGSSEGSWDMTKRGVVLFSAVGGLGYKGRVFGHSSFLEFRLEQSLNRDLDASTIFGTRFMTFSLFTGVAF